MVQPKYSPEEALHRIKLMMEYNTSKTLDENIQMISEQLNPQDLGYAAAGAATGAGLGGATLASTGAALGIGAAAAEGAALGTAAFPVVGTAIGALVGLGLGAIMKWGINKDNGKEGFEQLMQVCKSPGASKLVKKMSNTEIRTLAYSIEDAKGDWNDDEEAITAALQKVETIADLCSLDKKITGGLVEFLDGLTDSPDEWKMFTRPIQGMIEDTEIMLTPEEQKKSKGIPGDAGPARKKTGIYKPCSGTYSFGCRTSPSGPIGVVQGCLGLTADGKFGPNTKTALGQKGYTKFTDSDVDKICATIKPEEKPEISGEGPSNINATNTDF